jgi:3',5'-nucleoside bisphosphate phosphatase
MDMYKPKYECDLHSHTNRSDGNDSYKEIIDYAVNFGMKVLAITDHDITPLDGFEADSKFVKTEIYALKKGLILLKGIEYSCDTNVDDVHIIGLGCDWKDKKFNLIEQKMIQSKIEGYKKLCKVLTNKGYAVSWEELTEDKEEENVQRKHIFEMMAKKGYSETWQEAKLLVRNDPEFNIKRKKINPTDAINLIKDTGGISILAHPYLIDEEVVCGDSKISRFYYIEKLIESGLDGIEAAYTYNKTSYKGTQTSEEIAAEVYKIYRDKVDIISGGSDYHNDGKKGAKEPRMIGEKGISYECLMKKEKLRKLVFDVINNVDSKLSR